MTMLNSSAAKLSAYNRDSILSASPARLLTMLYDRLVLDLTRAESALEEGRQPVAWENLRHADQIVAELASTLRVDLWDGAQDLLELYRYVAGLIATASLERDAAPVRDALRLVEPLRDAWHQAATQVPTADAPVFGEPAGATPARRLGGYGPGALGTDGGSELGVA
jgi:flagellar protein FliS